MILSVLLQTAKRREFISLTSSKTLDAYNFSAAFRYGYDSLLPYPVSTYKMLRCIGLRPALRTA
jgi:hypothetical protein